MLDALVLLSSFSVICFYVYYLYWWPPYRAYLARLQKTIDVGRSRHWALRPQQAHEVPYLDQERVESIWREFGEQGFSIGADFLAVPGNMERAVPLPPPIAAPTGDVAKPTATEPPTVMFLRLFLSSEHKAVGLLTATIRLGQEEGRYHSWWHCQFSSWANARDGGEAWEYTTSNWNASENQMAVSSFRRRPRVLRTYRPGAPLEELWASHQTRREQVANAGDLEWKHPSLAEAEENIHTDLALMEQTWNAMTPLKMARRLRQFKKDPNKLEWLGELKDKL